MSSPVEYVPTDAATDASTDALADAPASAPMILPATHAAPAPAVLPSRPTYASLWSRPPVVDMSLGSHMPRRPRIDMPTLSDAPAAPDVPAAPAAPVLSPIARLIGDYENAREVLAQAINADSVLIAMAGAHTVDWVVQGRLGALVSSSEEPFRLLIAAGILASVGARAQAVIELEARNLPMLAALLVLRTSAPPTFQTLFTLKDAGLMSALTRIAAGPDGVSASIAKAASLLC